MFLIDDLIQAIGAWKAADAQQKSIQDAMGVQKDIYAQQRADQAPWLQGGQASLAQLLQQMQAGAFDRQLDPSQLAGDPGFQFRMAEGQKALERSAAARGGLNSGGFLKGLAQYSQGLASDEYQRAWDRNRMSNMDRFGRLSHLAGVGQSSAQSLGAIGSNYANSLSSLFADQGNAEAARWMGVSQPIAQGFRDRGKVGMSMMSMGASGIPTQGG